MLSKKLLVNRKILLLSSLSLPAFASAAHLLSDVVVAHQKHRRATCCISNRRVESSIPPSVNTKQKAQFLGQWPHFIKETIQ